MMDIYILDGLNGVSDLIDTFESCIWNMQFFGENDFELTVPGTQQNINRLTDGTLLVRDFDMGGGTYNNVMVVQNREISYDVEKGWLLKVTGGGLKTLVGRRVIWAQTNLTGSVEQGIRQVITDNIISPTNSARTIPNFILDAAQGFTDTFDVQLLGENIAEWLTNVCPVHGLGWDVYISGGKYVFKLYKGVNRTYSQTEVVPVVFSPQFDNLISAKYTYEKADYKNAALVGGEGEGVNQRTATIGTATGLERFEAYIDGGSVSSNGDIITLDTYIKMLEDYGIEQLTGTAFIEKFDGEIIPNGMYKLNTDYFLGDIVQIDNGFIQATSRIIELIYSEDETGTNLIPTFSDWEGV